VNGSVVVFVVGMVVLPLVLAEFGDWCPWLAARLVRWTARRLPDAASSSRYEEEWTANLDQVPGKLARLLAAVGYLACLPAMRRSIRLQLTPHVLPVPPALGTAQGSAVQFLASEAGIRQFLDIRVDMPAAVRTHELAWAIRPDSRIFYAAGSPALLPEALPQPYLQGSAVDQVTADPRDANVVLSLSARTLDFSQPIAVLLGGLLSHLSDNAEVKAIIGLLMQAMPSGSYLVLSESASLLHGDRDDQDARQGPADTSVARLSARVAHIIDGFELIEPSRISSSRELPGASLSDVGMSCVIARKS